MTKSLLWTTYEGVEPFDEEKAADCLAEAIIDDLMNKRWGTLEYSDGREAFCRITVTISPIFYPGHEVASTPRGAATGPTEPVDPDPELTFRMEQAAKEAADLVMESEYIDRAHRRRDRDAWRGESDK